MSLGEVREILNTSFNSLLTILTVLLENSIDINKLTLAFKIHINLAGCVGR
jgi:hypothetical protein